jgi:hypothetical protein
MLYELTNPSDRIIFEAPDLKIAGAVVGIVGGPACGAKPMHDTDGSWPIQLMAYDHGFIAGVYGLFGSRDQILADWQNWIWANHAKVIPALRSFIVGATFADYPLLATLSPLDREKWNDLKTSSFTEYWKKAANVAAVMEDWAQRQTTIAATDAAKGEK